MGKLKYTTQEIPYGKSRSEVKIEVPAGITLSEFYKEIGNVPGYNSTLSQDVTLVFLSEVHEWKN